VQQGDTLRSICYEIYGDYDYIEKVCLWNDIDDPNNILCGQKLLLR
jgi:prophage DNA circulation protein